jgi:hypothetical protein
MTFRRLYSADGMHNYFWKARPVGDTPVGDASAGDATMVSDGSTVPVSGKEA